MKLVISPDGSITVETPDSPSAAEFVRELYGARVAPVAAAPKAIEAKRVAKKPRRKKLAQPKADRPLTKAMDETWAWLAASDRPEGVTADEVAKAFGLSHAGGLWRINALIKREMAWRVGPGRYRVGSVADAEVMLNGARA
jgi:hypothetical protein